MVANDKIFLKIKNKIWLSIEKNIIKYGKIESRHKLIVIRDFCQATIRNIFSVQICRNYSLRFLLWVNTKVYLEICGFR